MRVDVDRGYEPEVMEEDDRNLPDLVRELFAESQRLLREEVRLAKAELRHEAKKAARGGAELGAGGAVGYVALMLLAATLVLIGATFLPAWLSALIVTVLFGVVAFALIQSGKKELKKTDPAKPVQHLKEDQRWAKETMQSIRSSRAGHA